MIGDRRLLQRLTVVRHQGDALPTTTACRDRLAIVGVLAFVGLYQTAAYFLNSTRITVGSGTLTIAHSPVPSPGNVTIDAAAVVQLYCQGHAMRNMPNGEMYAVAAILRGSDKPTLLVLNKADRVTDESYLHVLTSHHPRAVTLSAATGQGLGDLRDAVMEMLSSSFADAEVVTEARHLHVAGANHRFDGGRQKQRIEIGGH